jgi:hypothetical protein
MTTRKFLIGIAETMKNCAEAIATLSARLRRAEQTLELDFICGRWVRSHDSLALTVRKTDAGYRLVLFYRGRVAARFDAVVRADGTAVYAGVGIHRRADRL